MAFFLRFTVFALQVYSSDAFSMSYKHSLDIGKQVVKGSVSSQIFSVDFPNHIGESFVSFSGIVFGQILNFQNFGLLIFLISGHCHDFKPIFPTRALVVWVLFAFTRLPNHRCHLNLFIWLISKCRSSGPTYPSGQAAVVVYSSWKSFFVACVSFERVRSLLPCLSTSLIQKHFLCVVFGLTASDVLFA